MAIVISSVPGKIFQTGEKVTTAKLNQLGRPVLTISGSVGPTDVAPGDYTTVLTAGAYWYGLDVGAANTAQVTLSPAVSALVDGLFVAFKVNTANTGPVTLNINGLGAIAVKKYFDQDLDVGDWKPGQIVHVRYRKDANSIPAGAQYSIAGAYVVATVIGRVYTWTKGANDTDIDYGSGTLVASGAFTATQATATLHGTISALVTATLVQTSNVWQQLSLLGQNPPRYFPFAGASPFGAGLPGLVPAPNAGDQARLLRGDGAWVDAANIFSNSILNLASANEIFKRQNFI